MESTLTRSCSGVIQRSESGDTRFMDEANFRQFKEEMVAQVGAAVDASMRAMNLNNLALSADRPYEIVYGNLPPMLQIQQTPITSHEATQRVVEAVLESVGEQSARQDTVIVDEALRDLSQQLQTRVQPKERAK